MTLRELVKRIKGKDYMIEGEEDFPSMPINLEGEVLMVVPAISTGDCVVLRLRRIHGEQRG